jgi:hypothetical protein
MDVDGPGSAGSPQPASTLTKEVYKKLDFFTILDSGAAHNSRTPDPSPTSRRSSH